jgi:hypothetical protein
MRKIGTFFLVMSSFYLTENALTMEPSETTVQGTQLLDEQIKRVKEYGSKQGKQLLVLGVNNGEENLKDRFSADYIFLNARQDNPQDSRSLSVNFNDIGQLTQLAQDLPEFFDEIVLDASTFKFTDWTSEHLTRFKQMLKKGGKFIFGPSIDMVGRSHELTADEVSDVFSIAKKTSNYQGDKLVRSYTIPMAFPIDPTVNVDELYNRIQETVKGIKGNMEAASALKKKGLPMYALSTIQKENFKDFLKLKESEEKFRNQFLWEVLVPDNYQRIVEGVFGKGNVTVEKDKPLPFKSNYRETQEILITATKKA